MPIRSNTVSVPWKATLKGNSCGLICHSDIVFQLWCSTMALRWSFVVKHSELYQLGCLPKHPPLRVGVLHIMDVQATGGSFWTPYLDFIHNLRPHLKRNGLVHLSVLSVTRQRDDCISSTNTQWMSSEPIQDERPFPIPSQLPPKQRQCLSLQKITNDQASKSWWYQWGLNPRGSLQ